MPRPGDLRKSELEDDGVHTIIITIVDKSDKDVDFTTWKTRFTVVKEAYATFRECAELNNENIWVKLRSIPIVILPAELVLRVNGPLAFTTFDYIFVRSDQFNPKILRHELIHVYLYLSGRSWHGDRWHRSDLFRKCKAID